MYVYDETYKVTYFCVYIMNHLLGSLLIFCCALGDCFFFLSLLIFVVVIAVFVFSQSFLFLEISAP